MCCFINPDKMISTGFAIAGRFGMGGLFCIIFLYTTELYPTVIRQVSQFSNIRCHYEYTPMQYTEIFKVVKNENFQ